MIRRSWTRSVDRGDACVGAASLREVKQRILSVVHARARGDECRPVPEGQPKMIERKTGWMRAEAAGDPGPWRQQAILGRRDWDADALRDIVRDYAQHLADDDAVLVIDETGFLKQASVAGWRGNTLARQGRLRTARSASSLPMCRVMVTRSSIARCIFRRSGLDDPDCSKAAYVPVDIGFATKPKLVTRSTIARAIATSVPFKWVAGDTVYGVGDIEQELRREGKGYVLGVSSSHVFRSWGKRAPSPVRLRKSPRRGARPTGSAYQREPEPKDRGCTIGVILNWPTSMPGNSTVRMTVCGRAVY